MKRQIVDSADLLRECGMVIFPGFNRFLSTTCFFVVTTSQIGSTSFGDSSSELLRLAVSRFLVCEEASLRLASDFMCLRSADEALRVFCLMISYSATWLGDWDYLWPI